jgi:ATP-binding cassette, subfamily G (WHITE), member 2, PDR
MYRVSPLTYILEGLAIAGLANAKVTCADLEVVHIPIPQSLGNLTCADYLVPYVSSVGGRLLNPLERTMCEYCPFWDTNSLLAMFGMEVHHRWRNVGFVAVYIVFNVAATFGVYRLARVAKR